MPYYFKQGFTLVELMVVIAIVGILAAALFPSMTIYFGRSRNATRVSDLRMLNTALKAYYIDHDAPPPTPSATEGANCIGMVDGQQCWGGYVFNADVPPWKGRTNGVVGSTNFQTLLTPYIQKFPIDPLPNRTVGDRYIFGGFAGDIHCDGTQTVWGGGWLIWQPEKIHPTNDRDCLGQGEWGCCSGVSCGSHSFCLMRVDI